MASAHSKMRVLHKDSRHVKLGSGGRALISLFSLRWLCVSASRRLVSTENLLTSGGDRDAEITLRIEIKTPPPIAGSLQNYGPINRLQAGVSLWVVVLDT